MNRLVLSAIVAVVGLATVIVVSAITRTDAPAAARVIDGPPVRASGDTPDPELRPGQLEDPGLPRFSTRGWKTDFSISSVPLKEIFGVLPKDAIAAIDDPQFESIEASRDWLDGVAPVIALEIDGDARAYPLAVLTWHEIVNDVVGSEPVAVTFCPLCNTALTYDRTLDGVVHDFGVSGKLRFSDLVMYDRQTETFWQQATGTGIVGSLTGSRLGFRVSQIIGLDQFAETYPDGIVLSRDTGFDRNYGFNPYPGYDEPNAATILPVGVIDGRLAQKERVVTLGQGSGSIAFPYTELRKTGVAEVEFEDEAVLVIWELGAASALDELRIDDSADVGGTGVYSPIVDGERLTFVREGGVDVAITDKQTGSTWDVTGRAIDGPLNGTVLEPIAHADHFWFAWAAFAPGSDIWTPDGTVKFGGEFG